MNNELAAVLISDINAMLADLGLADRYRLSWSEELCNEAIVAGTVTDIDTSDEFILGIRLRKDGAPYDIYAEKSARHFLRHEVHVGDYLKVRAYLKPAAFNIGYCYLHVDDEADILQHIHEGGADNVD